ncbi:MAG TPA: S8/S53 family peptidase [Actinomycetota bacterium]|nr:S8/S53 family peptidase [Actinomycetota bacterium]
MRAFRTTSVAVCLALLAGAALAPRAASAKPRPTTSAPPAVVALIDTGINPYSPAFRDTSPLARRHPSTYLPGYPKDATELKLSLGLPYEEAVEKDAEVWKSVRRNKLYWIPGTRIAGAISFSAGGTSCPSPVQVPPVAAFVQDDCPENTILDDHGHGTMTASRAAGAPDSLAPSARIVAIEGLGAGSVRWAADQGWIDVQSNSWVNLVPPPLPSGTTEAFSDAAARMLTLAASGNGTAYLAGGAPTPTYLLSTAPPGVVLVGGHDNGKMTLWAGSPPHVVADAYAGMTAIARSVEEMRPDPIACCTSAASPYAAGGAIAIVTEARRLLKSTFTGVRDGIVACGRAGTVDKGPLADGLFTLGELKDLFLHSAEPLPAEGKDDGAVHWAGEPRPPDQVAYGPGGNPFCVGCTTTPIAWQMLPGAADAYQFVGYGGVNENSVKIAHAVLRGEVELPERAQADAQYEQDQALRGVVFGGNELTEPKDPATTCPAP